MVQGMQYHTYPELRRLLETSMKTQHRNYDLDLIDKAYELADFAHQSQKRVSGLAYVLHPVSVAYILVELGMDNESIIAAILHDVLEDTRVNSDQIRTIFGKGICDLVEGVTKLRFVYTDSPEEHQAENIKKILSAMSQDIRVIMIKLADRLQNMRTIGCMPEHKRRNKALQNMEIFAPIAHKLGIRTIKDEIEDISVKCLDPVACDEIERSLALSDSDRNKFINIIKSRIKDKIQDKFPKAHVEGRVKSLNEIYKKMFIKGKNLDQIYDVYALRIIVDSISDCYNIFGLIHDVFQPIPSRFKDYIAIPKSNMYQSLHTTVLSSEGIPFEVQIRTWDMHRVAEYGIATHWKYKQGRWNEISKSSYSWVEQMLDNWHSIGDITEVVSTIKSDLAPKEIFVLTPKGKVISMPSDSTAIDFAYAVHTELGNRMIGAKVNKKIVPINHVVKNGEIVEILVSNSYNKGPSRDWLNIVKTGVARSKIKQWFKKECRNENILEGRRKFELELAKYNISVPKNKLAEFLAPIFSKRKYITPDDFFAEVGLSALQLKSVMPRLYSEYMRANHGIMTSNLQERRGNNLKSKSMYSGVLIDGMNNCSVKFARCCSPLPHDEIIGFITRGNGVSIHKKDCDNIKYNSDNKSFTDRLVSAQWDLNTEMIFDINLKITANNDEDFLSNFMKKITELHLNLISLNTEIMQDHKIFSALKLRIKNPNEIKTISKKLAEVPGIISIRRD